MKAYHRELLAGSAIAIWALASTSALAQEAATAPQADAGIADIIVTAQRRDESLQKTSVVVSVIGQDTLARAGVTSAADISRIAPGVAIATATAAPQIYIRGVGDFAATGLNNPAIALNVDGVYVARPDSLPADFYDLERVEVLKGPQGTLYGRNASGGAINLITTRPKLGQFGGKFSTELGNYDAITTSGAINIPIGETIAVRVAGNYVRRDGFTNAGFGDANNEAIRVRALWEPSSAVSLLLNFSTGHVGGLGAASVIGDRQAGLGKFIDVRSPEGRAFITSRIPVGGFGVGPNVRSQVVLPDASKAGYDNDFTNVSAQFDADLGFATLTVIPAWRETKLRYAAYPFIRVGFGEGFLIQTNLNAPPSPFNQSFLPARPESSRAKSLEVRLGNEIDRLKWVVGGYYFDEDQHSQFTVESGPIQNIGLVSDLSTKALAAFAQATFSVTDSLRLIGGIRYTSDRRILENGATYAQPFSTFGFGPPPVFAPNAGPPFAVLVETYGGRRTFKNTSWKAGVEYDVAPDSLFFLTASTGFKAGGFNQLSRPSTPGVATSFAPEKLMAFDAGLKNRLFGNRLQLNLGAFYWDYKNQQVNTFGVNSVGGIGIEFVNAQKAEIYGANVDLLAKLWRGGTLTGALEYTKATYKRFIVENFNYTPGSSGCAVSPSGNFGPAGPAFNLDCSGFPVSRAPKWAGSIGLAQDFMMANDGRITVSGDMTFASSRELTFDYVAATRDRAYALLGANIGYTAPGDRFTIGAFVRNLTNREVFTGGSEPNFAPNTVVGQVQLPRTYGLRFAFNF